MRLIFGSILLAAAAYGACVQVSSDRVTAGDLFNTVPLLQGLDPGTPVGFAPLPGTVRLVSGLELTLIAHRQGIVLSAVPDVCIERTVRAITPDEMRAALGVALATPDAHLEIDDFSSQPLPPGHLEFRRSLSQPPASAPETPIVWRGKLIYDQGHSAGVWAKVRIAVDRPVFLAAENIPAGAIVRDEQVEERMARDFPYSGPSLGSSAEIFGKVTRHSIQAGQRITASALDEPKDIAKGDIIQVRVMEGPATLSLEGIAASSGKKGDTILVHNSVNGRNFRAVVEEKGRAVVRPAGGIE